LKVSSGIAKDSSRSRDTAAAVDGEHLPEEPGQVAKPPGHAPGGGIDPQQDAASVRPARIGPGHPDDTIAGDEPDLGVDGADIQVRQRRGRSDLTGARVRAPQPAAPVAPAHRRRW
jgi:hypothetical protein